MKKSTRHNKRRNKKIISRKVKRGGKKINQSLITSQIAGKLSYNSVLGGYSQNGGDASSPTPAPAPSSIYPYNLGNIDPTSLGTALQQFGDAVVALAATATTEQTAATLAQTAVTAQIQSAMDLKVASDALSNAYLGSGSQQGLYDIIIGSRFNPSPAAQSPAPASALGAQSLAPAPAAQSLAPAPATS